MARRTVSARLPWVTSLVSLTLVLLFLGIFALLGIGGRLYISQAKDSIEYRILLAEGVPTAKAQRLLTFLQSEPWVVEARFLTQEQVLKEYDQLGEELLEALDNTNPFAPAIHVRLHADYIQPDSITAIAKVLFEWQEVTSINYPIDLIMKVEQNTRTLSRWFGVVAAGLLLIAYLLVANTVKLAVFSRRLSIRSMQLIGATRSFIRRPFLAMGMWQGALAGLLAAGLLAASLWALEHQLLFWAIDPYMGHLFGEGLLQQRTVLLVFLALVSLGLFMGLMSSWVAVNRFLSKRIEDLA